MKLAAPNFKNIDYRQFFIDHGEKVAVGAVGLIVAMALWGTNWRCTDKSPSELIDKTKRAEQEILSQTWPQKEQQSLATGTEKLAEKVQELFVPVDAAPFALYPFNPPVRPDQLRISKPKWLPVENLIADAGKVDLLLDPSVPPVDEKIGRKIPKPDPKEKKEKEKAAKEKKRGDKKTPGQKEKKTDDGPIPEELKVKEGGSRGFGRPGGGGLLGSGSMGPITIGGDKRSEKRNDKFGGADGFPAAPSAAAETPKINGRGYRFVAVRGIFPLSDQIRELMHAMGDSTTDRKEVQNMIEFREFKLERQTQKPGSDPWSGPWETVDQTPVENLLKNEIAGFAPETVAAGIIDNIICMPYPDRLVGEWSKLATHPRVQNFVLSDEEVATQVKLEEKLVEKFQNEEEKRRGPEKKGWDSVIRDIRALQQRASTATGTNDPRSFYTQIIEDMKRESTNDPSKYDERLAEFVRKRATAIDHLLLFRYLDITVEPGKTYRYRVKLVVQNPFRGKHLEEVADPSIIEGEVRETSYSEPTKPVKVPEDAQFYVKNIHGGRASLPGADLDFYQWFVSTGTYVNTLMHTQVGEIVGGWRHAKVLRPTDNSFDRVKVPFSTNDALVDVAAGFSLDPGLHSDIIDALKASNVKRTAANAPNEALIVNGDGELFTLDDLEQQTAHKEMQNWYESQVKAFKPLLNDSEEDRGSGALDLRQGGPHNRKNDPRRRDKRADKGKFN